jgi:hypothetical protein
MSTTCTPGCENSLLTVSWSSSTFGSDDVGEAVDDDDDEAAAAAAAAAVTLVLLEEVATAKDEALITLFDDDDKSFPFALLCRENDIALALLFTLCLTNEIGGFCGLTT